MSKPLTLPVPFDAATAGRLYASDRVVITGTLFTARDAAHRRLCRLIQQGRQLPLELQDQVIYFVGPTPAPPGCPIGAAGPTTSSRMDAFSPLLYAHGLRATIGKGYRNAQVVRALQEFCAVHFAALGGAGALLSKCITGVEIVAYEDLGTEAIRKLRVKDFPVTVAYDAHGNSVYEIPAANDHAQLGRSPIGQ